MDTLMGAQCPSQNVGAANQLFSVLIEAIFAAQCSISPPEMWPKDYGPIFVQGGEREFDFIVVGSGSAGAVVAGRLSENPNWNVLLLEAGGDPPVESEIPFMTFLVEQTPYDWGFRVEKSTKFSKSIPEGSYWPRGKFLGGTSGINAMVYVRGNSRDFDQWEQMGNPTWGWRDVKRYFMKSEDNQNPDLVKKHPYHHATGGPMKISPFNMKNRISDMIIQGGVELGFKHIEDINNEEHVGVATAYGTVYKGRRWSTARGYLTPARHRPNLKVIKYAHATKVDFDQTNRATGVRFLIKGKEYFAKAKNEVILSAGAIGSPHILLNSGVGPEKLFRKLGMRMVKDLKVGWSLQDHCTVPIVFKIPNNENKEENVDDIYQYLMNRAGPLAGQGIFDTVEFFNTVNLTDRYPDIQTGHIGFPVKSKYLDNYLKVMGYESAVVQSIKQANMDGDLLFTWVTLLNPKSLGKISIRSSNPMDLPVIEANYIDHPDDMKSLVNGLRLKEKYLQTTLFKEAGGSLVRPDIPGCRGETEGTDRYWECYVRHLISTLYHPTSTCKMNPASDRFAVVDSRLRVHGLKGIRVADASIMPLVTSGNTNAPTIMIGEKAADFIKEDYGYYNTMSQHDEF